MELQGPIKVAGQAGGGGAGQVAGRAGNPRECPQRTAPAGQARVQAFEPEVSREPGRQEETCALQALEPATRVAHGAWAGLVGARCGHILTLTRMFPFAVGVFEEGRV